MKKYRFAYAAGAVIVAYHLVLNFSFGDIASLNANQWQQLEMLANLRYVFIIMGVVLSIWSFRNNSNSATGFRSLFVVGLAAATILAHIVGLFEFFFILTHPAFFDLYMRVQEQLANQGNISAEQLQHTRHIAESMRFMQTPLMNGIFYFVETLLIGALSAALASFGLRRSDNQPPSIDRI